MSYTKNILLDRAMQEEPHGVGFSPNVPFILSAEEAAQIEREQALQHALDALHTMKDFWKSGDRIQKAFAMKFFADAQEWLNYLYFDADFLSFGSDAGFASSSPEPEPSLRWRDNEVRRLDDAAWEVYHV